MYVLENPVLQRELLVNLRTARAFVLMLVYQTLLGIVVYFAWPQQTHLDLSTQPQDARKLADMFFLGQYVLASLMAPSFAAGAITGEKERRTYELLLASPLRPGAIVFGKMVASLAHLVVLIFSSLPIVMLCLTLGGVSPYEVMAAYLGLIVSVITFAAVAVACSSYFDRTAASLSVSYLVILPMALAGVVFWNLMADFAQLRLILMVTLIPGLALTLCAVLFMQTAARLLHPPDIGSEGKEVVDLDQEAKEVVGLFIQRDHFPDRLFAPPKRTTLLPDRANPVYDKEIRSEIFGHGTLMLRVVIQVSIALAILLMAFWLFIWPQYVAWYIAYVLVFNLMVGPVFSAGSITSERERQTLELLLTTTLRPWEILWGKLFAGLRVSSVLTLFVLWPLALACAVPFYWANLGAVIAYVLIVLVTCVNSATLGLFCSTICQKTSTSLMTTYALLIILFCGPVATQFFARTFHPEQSTGLVNAMAITSPFAAALDVPLVLDGVDDVTSDVPADREETEGLIAVGYGLFSVVLNAGLLLVMTGLVQHRWRLIGQRR